MREEATVAMLTLLYRKTSIGEARERLAIDIGFERERRTLSEGQTFHPNGVNPPPWINATRSADGKLTVIDDRVAVVDHYAVSIDQESLMSDPSSARGQALQRKIERDSDTLH